MEGALCTDGLTTVQRSAMQSYRKNLRYKIPAWAYIPVNVAKLEAGRERRRVEEEKRAQQGGFSEGEFGHGVGVMVSGRSQHSMHRTPSLLASGIGPINQRAETDSRELRRRRGQIWDIVLNSATPRRSSSLLRRLHEASDVSDSSESEPSLHSCYDPDACAQYTANSTHSTQQRSLNGGEDASVQGLQEMGQGVLQDSRHDVVGEQSCSGIGHDLEELMRMMLTGRMMLAGSLSTLLMYLSQLSVATYTTAMVRSLSLVPNLSNR